MQITVNGETHPLEKEMTLEALLEQLSFSQKRIAVELNREIISHGQYQNRLIQAGDRIEIIHAIGGG